MEVLKKRESRRFPRVSVKFPTRYKMRRGGFYASALTKDLSICGAQLNADRFFPKGVNFNLELNILSRIINPVGTVVWSRSLPHSDEYRMGIDFIEINSEDRRYLSDYINMHLTNFAETTEM